MSAAADRSTTAKWFELVYAALPGVLPVVTLPGGSARFYRTANLDAAADFALHRSTHANVYAGCCTLAKPPDAGRGRAADTLAAPGVWADLDLAGPGHRWGAEDDRELRLPASIDEAVAILDPLDLPPTAVVASGHGLQVWWLFDAPAVFETSADRDAFAALSAGFGHTLAEHGRRRGLHVDNVSDLPRILRPVGTVNRKREPKPVSLVESHPERRYTPADVVARCIVAEPARTPPRPVQRPRLDGAESPAEALARCVSWADVLEPAGFALLWQRGDAAYWHHPASTTGPRSVSATTDANGTPVLVVHSESAAAATGLPVGAGHRLTKFRAWSILNYRGDQSAAATALRELGRGVA